jgi:hypothetical protein
MADLPDPTDVLLLSLDPARGLQILGGDLQRFTDLDPKVREAVDLMKDRLDALSPEEQAGLMPVLWTHLRGYVQSPVAFHRLRRMMQNGSFLLAAVEATLSSTFQADTLKRVAADTDVLVKADSAKAGRIQTANDELTPTSREDVPPFAAAIVIGLGVAATLAAPVIIASDIYDYTHPVITTSE